MFWKPIAIYADCIYSCLYMYYRWRSNYQYWVVFVASPLSTQHYEERVKTGWLGVRIMCQSWEPCL